MHQWTWSPLGRRVYVERRSRMAWWKKDYEGPAESQRSDSTGRSGGGGNKGLWRLRLPFGMENGRDILYLDDDPFRFYEHCGKDDKGHWTRFAVCRRKNNIGEECPPCGEKNINLYNIGFFTAIDISFAVGKEYQGNRNYYLCERRLVGAKRGSTDYPGALADIHRIREREGRLRGLVIHQIRKGKKSPQVGDTFEVIERLKPEPQEMLDYIKRAARKLYTGGVIKRVCDLEKAAMPPDRWYGQKFEGLVFDPAPYEEIFQPQSAADLANLYGLRYEGSGGRTPTDSKDDPFFDYGNEEGGSSQSPSVEGDGETPF